MLHIEREGKRFRETTSSWTIFTTETVIFLWSIWHTSLTLTRTHTAELEINTSLPRYHFASLNRIMMLPILEHCKKMVQTETHTFVFLHRGWNHSQVLGIKAPGVEVWSTGKITLSISWETWACETGNDNDTSHHTFYTEWEWRSAMMQRRRNSISFRILNQM